MIPSIKKVNIQQNFINYEIFIILISNKYSGKISGENIIDIIGIINPILSNSKKY